MSAESNLAGEKWLLQPVSPRIVHAHVATTLLLRLHGYLPPAHVDVAGRVIMVCSKVWESPPDAQLIETIEDCKWIRGWQKVEWTLGQAPLDDPAFALVPELVGVTETSYGAYRHSTDLPPWPS